jgi:hypothetical protein
VRTGIGALSSGLVNKAQGGEFGTGALMGAGAGALGEAGRMVAPSIAEGALKVRGNQRLFGRTVGKAILEDTSGFHPENIARSAGETIRRLTPEIEQLDVQSARQGLRGSLAPARQAVAGRIAGHEANRAMQTAADIRPVENFLTTDQLTNLPLSAQQTAPGLRALKRGLNADFISNWKLERPAEQTGAARQAYGLINEQLHGISPETRALDQRISSLIPVELQGQRIASQAPFMQRVAGRIGAHTGALAGGIGGGLAGYREGGLPGALLGGTLGIAVPEALATPEAQMIAARGLNAPLTSRAIRAVITPAARYLVPPIGQQQGQ